VGTRDRSHTETWAPPDTAACPPTELDPQHPDRSVSSGRLKRVGARDRLERELRSIAVDLLGPNEADEFPGACTEWVATTTGAAVSRVCDTALGVLIQELDSLLADAPLDVVRELRRARLRHEAGFV
jgi:hypothetical protein